MYNNLFETCPSLENFLKLIAHLNPTEVVTTKDYSIYKVRDNFYIGYSIKWPVREICHSLEEMTKFLNEFTNADFVSPNDIYYSRVESVNKYLYKLLEFSQIADTDAYPETNSDITTKHHTCGYKSIWYWDKPFLLYYVHDYNNTQWWLTSPSAYKLAMIELAKYKNYTTDYIVDPAVPLKDISIAADEFTRNLF